MCAVGLLTACTAPQPIANQWDITSFNVGSNFGPTRLNRPDRTFTTVSGFAIARIQRVGGRVERAAGYTGEVRLFLMEQTALNAASETSGGVIKIGITLPMIDAIGTDDSALAVLLGHELAHQLRHHNEARAAREDTRQGVAGALGLVLAIAHVPGANSIANAGTQMVTLAYSRDDEREADADGFSYATRAGYDPDGGMRLFEILQREPSGVPFLSTHPMSSERVETMRRLAQDHISH